MKLDAATYKLVDKGRIGTIVMVIGIIGLIVSAIAWSTDSSRFYHAWLVATTFWVSLGLFGLFYTMLHHLTGAHWSVVVRRLLEAAGMQLPWMILLFIPIYFGMHDLFHWSHEEAVAHDPALAAKAGYLNIEFFFIRIVAYFAIWSVFAWNLYRKSIKQDETADPALTGKLRALSAGGMILFAFTLTFASFDWLMSLNPHWYSTIFGVYWFGGIFFAGTAFVTMVALYLRSQNVLQDNITVEHYHDLGKLMFGFTVFWSYIGFSQYLLIWYGNVPEETIWYSTRLEGSWFTASMFLLFGHFVIPFVIMVFRGAKRNLTVMAIMTVWFLAVHWIDMYWLVYPTLLDQGNASLSWIDFAPTVGIGGIFLWLYWLRLSKQALLPIGDSLLMKSLKHINQ